MSSKIDPILRSALSIISFETGSAGVNFDTFTFDFLREYDSYTFTTSGFGGYSANSDAYVSGSKLIYQAVDGSIMLDPIAQGKDVADVVSGTLTNLSVVDHGVTTLNVLFRSSTYPLPPKGPIEGISAAGFYNLVIQGDNEGLKEMILRGNDTISGTKFDDVIDARTGNDTIFGENGNDTLRGGDGNDLINGGKGYDLIYGGKGADILTGGAGGDNFEFKSLNDSRPSAIDTIFDYTTGPKGDLVDLHVIDANTKAAGNQAFTYIGKAQFGHKPGQLRSEVKDGNTYVYGDVNGDKTPDFAVKFMGTIVLDKTEFIL